MYFIIILMKGAFLVKGKLIIDIKKEIRNYPSNSAWDDGIKSYAEEIFNNHIEDLDNDYIEQITEKDLLGGAIGWKQYSYGGFSLIYDSDICKRLCTSFEQRILQYGKLKLSSNEEWLEV